MSDLDLSKEIPVRSFGFNVPCRRFVLAAKVTRDRRMPLVDEFVLRALKLADQLTLARLAAFFGFSTAETQTVVSDLTSRSLVIVDGENVRLHPSANEMFRTSANGIPTMLEIESWVEILWFDLISGNMIAKGIRHGKNLIEMEAPTSRESIPAEFARGAFEENFRDYLKNNRKIHNPDAFSLYAVTDVQPSQYGFVAIGGREDLVLRPTPKMQVSLLESDSDQPRRLRKLSDAMRKAYDGLTDPDPSAVARSEYAKLTGSTTLQVALSNGWVDLERWLAEEKATRRSGTEPLVGAPYLERNRQIFRRVIDTSEVAEPLAAQETAAEIVWVRPGGSSWGASDDLRAMLAEIRAGARKVFGLQDAVRTALVVPVTERNSRPQRFNRLFDEGLLAPAGYLALAVEVIVLRGVAAAVLVWVRLSDSCAIWIGRATNHPDDLRTIEERLNLTALQAQPNRLWSRANQ